MKKITLFLTLCALLVPFSSCDNDSDGTVDGTEGGVVFNEVNGNGDDADKYIELYNTSATEISLAGFTIYYNNYSSSAAVTWTGTDETIAGGGYLTLKGTKNTTEGNEDHALSLGLSGTQGIILQLYDAGNDPADYLRVPADSERSNNFARIPDGTGEWYFDDATGTEGTSNGTVTSGKDKILLLPLISEMTRSVILPTPDDIVTVSAEVTPEEGDLTSVVMSWSIDSGTPTETDMELDLTEFVYKATIAAQPEGTLVEYTVTATNANGTATLSDSYTVSSGAVDYSGLVINEIDGSSKIIEIYNNGTVSIPLIGVYLVKNNNGSKSSEEWTEDNWWTGTTSAGSIDSGQYILIGNGNEYSGTAFYGNAGISNKQNLRFALYDPAGNVLGEFERGTSPWIQSSLSDIGSDVSFQRCPNATGEWQLAAPTNGAANPSTGTDIPQE